MIPTKQKFWSAIITAAAALPTLTGCTAWHRAEVLRQGGGNAALVGQFQAYDGHCGQAISFDQVVAMAQRADVVLFGEEHSDVVCNAVEAQLLAKLSLQERPVTLAMEFFEVDTQPALDAYLNERMSESEFRTLTRQKQAYMMAHRPLIEYCRMTQIPVIAANAPWRLTRALRLSGKSFEEFRATTQPADRALLPLSSELLSGEYHERFVEAMKDHVADPPGTTTQSTTQPSPEEKMLRGYRAQSLWDDTMAQSIAEHRGEFPEQRVMLIVGKFHVAHDGGTGVKVRRRRPQDSILTIVYHGVSRTPLVFDAADSAAGDVIIYGVTPPEESEPAKPTTTSPAATTAPASGAAK
jgi:uncharacterized iron-regulated protein